jgi:heterokaryon incompatibility protein (HET)
MATEDTQYVALSYVWGKPRGDSNHNQEETSLENGMPGTIQDGILVTQQLGFKYLWVDKYCIGQNDSDKHEQIQQMDKIYENAEVTLVGTAGEDAQHGLPGVGETPRSAQGVADYGNFSIFSTVSGTHDTILSSTWNRRGWTFQEAALSRRQLVFTQEQVYFECCNMNCFESVPINLSPTRRGYEDLETNKFLHSGIFSPSRAFPSRLTGLDAIGISARNEYDLVSRYSRKTFTYPTDRLNAFTGIMKRTEETHVDLHHLWAVQLNLIPSNIVLEFVQNLLWTHGGRNGVQNTRNAGRREWKTLKIHQRISTSQYKAPSWSWAGWNGGVFFPFRGSPFKVGTSGVHGVALELECQSLNLADMSTFELKALNFLSQKVVLCLDVDVIDPNCIHLSSSYQSVRIKDGGALE